MLKYLKTIEKCIVMYILCSFIFCGCTNDKENEAYDSMKKEMENKKSRKGSGKIVRKASRKKRKL